MLHCSIVSLLKETLQQKLPVLVPADFWLNAVQRWLKLTSTNKLGSSLVHVTQPGRFPGRRGGGLLCCLKSLTLSVVKPSATLGGPGWIIDDLQ